MSKMVKLEALIGMPPTGKCRETIGILEEVVRQHPDEVRLVVFRRGDLDYPEPPSVVMSCLVTKGSIVPACIINGTLFSKSQVPNREELEAEVQRVLSN